MMKEIRLSQGYVALIDDEDFDNVSRYKWQARPAGNTCYAVRNFSNADSTIYVSLHRYILNAPRGKTIDHINRNGLDNRRSNLRFVSLFENARNKAPCLRRANRSSRYKGVLYRQRQRRFAACIRVGRKNFHLGYYRDEIAAAVTYDIAAMMLFGEYAYLNFPDIQTKG
jgi:hypothetical protein